MEWSRLQLHDVVYSERITMRHAAKCTIRLLPAVMGVHSVFFVPGDLDIQTRPSEGPNMFDSQTKTNKQKSHRQY